MKKLFLNALLVIAGMMLSHNLFAQYPIPSFNVPVVVDPTIFEEINPSSGTNFNNLGYSLIQPDSREEKKFRILAKDNNILNQAWVIIDIYSLDGSFQYGPYTVTENNIFEMTVDNNILWGIRVKDASQDCVMDVWFE